MRGERFIRRLGRRVRCPNCDTSFSRFAPGPQDLPGRRCWRCDSLERHRALALALAERPHLLGQAQRILHLAPEPSISRVLPAHAEVIRADLDPAPGDHRVDVSDMRRFADGRFDAVICMHVLEHVPDDRAALREMRRVLDPAGWAVIHAPVTVETTVEDPFETDPAERLRRFGQADHHRLYGRDFFDRIAAAGFRVEIAAFAGREDVVERHGLRAPVDVESVTFAFPVG